MSGKCVLSLGGKNIVEKQLGENKMYPNKDFDCVPPEDVDYRYEWRTKDGRVIPYYQMTTTHLENTYDMLERMMCRFQNKCHDIDDYYEPPEWVGIAMDAIAKELGRRELNYAQKMTED